jgi:hypothetical protein
MTTMVQVMKEQKFWDITYFWVAYFVVCLVVITLELEQD